MKNETHVLKTTTIVSGGEALSRHPDGYVVFVSRGAPDETVEVEFLESHRQWRRAHIVNIVEPSPHRADPPCPHYASCGGCHLQHLTYDAQLMAKTQIVTDALRRIGKFEVDEIDIEGSERTFGYRNRVSFVVKRGDSGSVAAGFHGVSEPGRVIDIDACPLAEDTIAPVWQTLREQWGPGAALLPGGDPLRLTLRATVGGDVAMVIEGARNRGELDTLIERVPGLAAAWTLDANGRVIGHAGAETVTERVGEYEVALSGNAFVQVNRAVAEALDAYALAQCGALDGIRVVDAYCGFGTRALAIATHGASVTGIDIDHFAIATARALSARQNVSVEFVDAAVERSIARALPADIVILNPPRRGVARAVVQRLLARPPARLVYVSCNPATLARDLNALQTAYVLEACRAFDLFPQTAHVETVATLARRS